MRTVIYCLLVFFLAASVSFSAEKVDAKTGASKKKKGRSYQTVSVSSGKPYAVSQVDGNSALFYSGRQAAATAVVRSLLKQYEELSIQPAKTCPDNVFIRRVFLDLTGTIPTSEQARSFGESRSSKKRAEVIDFLLQSDGFTDYSAMLWCDRLRVKSEFPINLWPNAVQAYHRWILTALRDNRPYDQFARELLISNVSNFRVPQVNFFRAVQNSEPEFLARAVALTFMGCRLDAWPEERQNQLAEFFSDIRFNRTGEWKEEIVYADLFRMSTNRRPTQLTLPDGVSVDVPLHLDSRVTFADWQTGPQNPWYAKNTAHRIW